MSLDRIPRQAPEIARTPLADAQKSPKFRFERHTARSTIQDDPPVGKTAEREIAAWGRAFYPPRRSSKPGFSAPSPEIASIRRKWLREAVR